MKFVELKKHLITNNFYHCYNLFGDDSFLIDSSKNLLFKYASNQNEFDRIMLSAENFNQQNVLSILNTPSFFGGNKIVVLTGVEKTKNKDVLKLVEDYSKFPNSQSIFILISNESLFDENKFNSKNFFCNVDCNRLDRNTISSWINATLKEKNATITDEAKLLLIDYTNEYLSRISLELEKLISYSNGNITKDDVELLVEKSLEFSVFELTENIGIGNRKKTFEILSHMMEDKKSAPTVLSLIQNYFRRMLFSAITPKTNLQIANELGVKEYAVKKAKETSKLFSKIALKDIVELCGELDFKVKSGQTNYKNAVYYLIMYILESNRKSI